MMLLASTLPSNDGYVAAAYVFFFALILLYVAIMATRLSRVERKLRDMQRSRADSPSDAAGIGEMSAGDSDENGLPTDDAVEREVV